MTSIDSRTDRVVEGMAIWGAYYRSNIDIFVKEYLQFDFLRWFQRILLVMMNASRNFVWIASRGMGKSFLIAIFSVARCILYPGTKVVIASGTRGQAITIFEKIQNELLPISPNLHNEIDFSSTRFAGQDAKITFKNTSFIKVVTAADSARSNRATLLIVDEARMVKKDVLDAVLSKFLTSRRMPKYSELSKAERDAEYAKEPNKVCLLSSAFYKDNWLYTKVIDTFKLMLDDTKSDFVCGLPYELSIQEGLLFPEDIEGEMFDSNFSDIKWGMEMEALFYGSEEGAFFNFDSVAKNRRIPLPMLTDREAALLGNSAKVKIPPKVNGEKRILSADIALMSSKKHNNDATAVFINQMMPTKSGRYTSNIVYGDAYEGLHTGDQALVIRKLFDEFACDYLVLDCQGLGLGIFDALVRDIVDPDTGEIYPALNCCNSPEMAERCTTKGAEKVIWAIKGSAALNSDCAVLLREGFRSGKVRLLVNEYDAEIALSGIKGYASLDPDDKARLLMPYINTTLLVDELVKLNHEDSNGRIKVYEKAGMRKDRYSSLSYNYYVATQIESTLTKRRSTEMNNEQFIIKPPKGAKKGGGEGWMRKMSR